jgi:hypothetical protein
MMGCFRQYVILALICCTQLCANQPSSKQLKEQQTVKDPFAEIIQEPGTVSFTPPTGWRIAEKPPETPHVQLMIVGKGHNEYPPSMNLVVEEYNGSLKNYLKKVKAINDSQKSQWKDLGNIRTAAGNASLSQLDFTNEWGNIRMMHVMLVKSGHMYILTAAALKEEFPKYYKEFFSAFRSLTINDLPPAAVIKKMEAIAHAELGAEKELSVNYASVDTEQIPHQ